MHRFQTQQDVPDGEKWLFQLYRYSEKLGLTLSGNTDRYTALLYLYLLIEWTVDSGNSDYTLPTTAQTKSGLKNYADIHRAEIESDEWLKDAFDEIREFSALSARMKRQQNPLFLHSDLAYNAMLLVSGKIKSYTMILLLLFKGCMISHILFFCAVCALQRWGCHRVKGRFKTSSHGLISLTNSKGLSRVYRSFELPLTSCC